MLSEHHQQGGHLSFLLKQRRTMKLINEQKYVSRGKPEGHGTFRIKEGLSGDLTITQTESEKKMA